MAAAFLAVPAFLDLDACQSALLPVSDQMKDDSAHPIHHPVHQDLSVAANMDAGLVHPDVAGASADLAAVH
jgi:hypothetical protein